MELIITIKEVLAVQLGDAASTLQVRTAGLPRGCSPGSAKFGLDAGFELI